MSTKFTDYEIKVLQNFAGINPSIIVEPDKLQVKNIANSVIGVYPFDSPHDFEMFGIYETQDFLSVMSVLDKPEFEVHDKYLTIKGSNNDKVRYFTTALDLIQKVPKIEDKFKTIDCELQFSLPADKLAIINKMISILKAKFIFFETIDKKIRITVGDDLDSSLNNYEIDIEDNIKSNCLPSATQINVLDFKILPGDYDVKISTKKITKWTNYNNVSYYIHSAVIGS